MQHCFLVFWDEEILLPQVYFCVYSVFQWGGIGGKILPKAEGLEKNIKRGMAIQEEFKPSAHNEFSFYPWNAGICKIIGWGLCQLSGFGFPMKFQYSLWFLPCLVTHG